MFILYMNMISPIPPTPSNRPIMPNTLSSASKAPKYGIHLPALPAFQPTTFIQTPAELINLINQGQVVSVKTDPKNTAAPYHIKTQDAQGHTRNLIFNPNQTSLPPGWQTQLATAMSRHQLSLLAQTPVLQKAGPIALGTLAGGGGLVFVANQAMQLYKEREAIKDIPFIQRFIAPKRVEKVTLDQVAGLEDEILYLRQQVINPINRAQKAPTQAEKLDELESVPRAILMAGPSGSGKTWLAKAVAGETKAYTMYIPGSRYIDDTPEVRQKIDADVRKAKSMSMRGNKITGHVFMVIDEAHDMSKTARSHWLTVLDGADKFPKCITPIICTNDKSNIRKDFVRQGRVEFEVPVEPPLNAVERKAIFDLKVKKNPSIMAKLDPEFAKEYDEIALELCEQMKPDANGATIHGIVREAKNIAMERGQVISQLEMKKQKNIFKKFWTHVTILFRKLFRLKKADEFQDAYEKLTNYSIRESDFSRAIRIVGYGRVRRKGGKLSPEETRELAIEEWARALVLKGQGKKVQSVSVLPTMEKEPEKDTNLRRLSWGSLWDIDGKPKAKNLGEMEEQIFPLLASLRGKASLWYRPLDTKTATETAKITGRIKEGILGGFWGPQLYDGTKNHGYAGMSFDEMASGILEIYSDGFDQFFQPIRKQAKETGLNDINEQLEKAGEFIGHKEVLPVLKKFEEKYLGGTPLEELWKKEALPLMVITPEKVKQKVKELAKKAAETAIEAVH